MENQATFTPVRLLFASEVEELLGVDLLNAGPGQILIKGQQEPRAQGFLLAHPAASFFVLYGGDGMKDLGIAPGDILVVDRALEPEDQAVVVAQSRSGLFLTQVDQRQGSNALEKDPQGQQATFWGVVTHLIHPL